LWVVKEWWVDKIEAWWDNTFDIFFDLSAADYRKWRFVLKSYPKTIESIKEMIKKAKVKDVDVKWDDKKSASEYWDLLEKEKVEWSADSFRTAMVNELWIRWFDETSKKHKVRCITSYKWIILDVLDPSYSRYPFFVYNPEKQFNSTYWDSWIKDLVSLNKSLDKMVSQIESYIDRMLKWKMLVRKWIEVTSITDKWAEMIYYKWNVPPTQLNLQPLPSTPMNFVYSLETWIEELWGIGSASLGKSTWSIQSWKGIEALQAADAQNVSEPVENLELFIAEIWEFILEIISKYKVDVEKIYQDWEEIQFTWKDVWSKAEWVVKVKPAKVTVEIVPEIAYSNEEKYNRMLQLVQLWLIDAQSVLEKLSVSNISDIVERVKLANNEKMKEQLMVQNASHWDWNSPEDEATLADEENRAMSLWRNINKTPQSMVIPEHTKLHMSYIQQYPEEYKASKWIFDDHILAEEEFLNKNWKL
jgi:hypothetical protein